MKNKALAAPYLVWMAIFTVVPLGIVIWFSFTDSITGAFTFGNISRMGTYLPIFLKSIWLAILSSLICLVIGYPVAYCLASAAPERQRFLYMLVMLPMCMSFLLRTLAWVALLDDTGIINGVVTGLGLRPLPLIRTDGAVVLGMVYNYLPYMIMPLYTVLVKLDPRLTEAAEDLGCTPAQVFGQVTLPLSVPGIISGFTMVFVPAVSTFYISQKMGSAGTTLIGDVIESQFKAAYNPNLGAALSLVLMVMVLVCIAVMNRFCGRRGGRNDMKTFNRVFTVIVFLFLYIPMIVLAVASFNAGTDIAVWKGFTFAQYGALFRDGVLLPLLANSVIVAVIASLVATVLGTMAAIGIRAMSGRMRRITMAVTNIPLTNPEIVTGVSLALLFAFAGQMMKLNNVLGFTTLLIAHITFNLPYVILSVMPKLGQLDPNLLDAALDLGCTPVQAFFKVIIHEIMPGILSGALMAFTMSLDDFVISYFVYGPSFVTLPVEIYNYTKKPLQPKIYALFTLLFLAILLVMVVMNLVQAGDERRRRQARGVFGKKGANA